MARITGSNATLSINSVVIGDELNKIDLKIDQAVLDTTAFADAANTSVVGKYGGALSVAGSMDPASAQGDATIFALIGNAGVVADFIPGGGGASANNPRYSSTVQLKSYGISVGVAQAATYSAEFQPTGAITRNLS